MSIELSPQQGAAKAALDDAELVRQLRAHEEQISVAGGSWWETPEVCMEAADRIEALTAERDEARAKLAVAVEALEAIYGDPDGWTRDAIRDLPALDLTPQPDEAEKWKRAFAAQSSKLQAVLHIPGVKDALAAMEGKP